VLFTANPVTGKRTAVINASWGLGEAIVSVWYHPDTITATIKRMADHRLPERTKSW
jgi:phosphoenolpyruvate synthase/pyruvate phosphate dikinase